MFQELFSRLPDIEVPQGVEFGRGESSLVLGLQAVPAAPRRLPGCALTRAATSRAGTAIPARLTR